MELLKGDLGDFDLGGGSFKMDLQELDLLMLTGFSWRRIGSSDVLLWKSRGNIGVDERLGIF
jgi:hypothetical protein